MHEHFEMWVCEKICKQTADLLSAISIPVCYEAAAPCDFGYRRPGVVEQLIEEWKLI